MSKAPSATLFSPVTLGGLALTHRIVMAPLTRSRTLQPDSVPGDLMREYYEQRTSEGGLIIGEATNISVTSRGWLGAPGLYSDAQVAGWKKITSAVKAKGGRMIAQLWHTGRSSHTAMTGGELPVSASVNPDYWLNPKHLVSIPGGWSQPSPHRELSSREIRGIVQDYRRAAERAIDAGFDGVELHAANGYLVDQFLQNGSNQRTDQYGGSIENRNRFLSEIVVALISVWGPGGVGGPHRAKRNLERGVGQRSRSVVLLRCRTPESVSSRLPESDRATHRRKRPGERRSRRRCCRVAQTYLTRAS